MIEQNSASSEDDVTSRPPRKASTSSSVSNKKRRRDESDNSGVDIYFPSAYRVTSPFLNRNSTLSPGINSENIRTFSTPEIKTSHTSAVQSV